MYLLNLKNFAQIFMWNFKDYPSFSLLAKKATKLSLLAKKAIEILSNHLGELHNSSEKPFQLPQDFHS